jgi:hypothetical protein
MCKYALPAFQPQKLTADRKADYLTPVLLQQLLRAMQDLHSPRRAAFVYALLSLVARLIASQTAVFSLWFGRRAYERSRGEMITMLFEKMLTRKVVGLQGKQPPVDSKTGDDRSTDEPDGKSTQEKQSASMGKVLNLMR